MSSPPAVYKNILMTQGGEDVRQGVGHRDRRAALDA